MWLCDDSRIRCGENCTLSLSGFLKGERAPSFSSEAGHPLALHPGAGDEARTRYLHLGKVALYQMSYARIWPKTFPLRRFGGRYRT